MFSKYRLSKYSRWIVFSLALTASGLSAAKGYQIDLRGLDNWSLTRSIKESSNLYRYKKNKPRSLSALKYRANSDTETFLDVLQAYGYYDACIQYQTFRKPNGKYRIVVAFDKGDPYDLSSFEVSVDHPTLLNTLPLKKTHLRDFDVRLNRPVRSSQIVHSTRKVIERFTERGYPLAKLGEEEILVDQAQKKLTVALKVDPGPRARFGTIHLDAESKIKSKFIRNRIQWDPGQLYDSSLLKETEKALYDTGLFSLVNITREDHLDAEGNMPVHVHLMDSKYNALTLGGSYTTTWEGFGGQVIWQTRNLFASGSSFELNYQVNQKSQEAGLKYTFYDFISKKQLLVLTSSAADNRQPNYTEKAVKTDLFVERVLSNYFTTSLGARFDQLETSDSDNNGFFSLFGIPLNLNTQSSENVLINPTQGGWGNLAFTPYFSLRANDGNFVEIKLEGSLYQYVIPSRRIVLAFNGTYGALFGEDNFDIPTPYRFFAGSPNNLRGYPYQEISPLDGAGKPIGGRSILLGSVESRFMVLKSVAVVGFMDVGNVFLSAFPKWNTSFYKSLGVGVRYFSFVGPLRLDIGFPLNKPQNITKNYQIYFSFGQPF